MGNLISDFKQNVPPKPKFSVDDIPDLSGKVIIVTGANMGIGKETVKALLQHNAKVYLAARSQEKAKEAIADLKSQTGEEAVFLQLDLADLHSVKRAAEEFTQKETQLHVLFNNAGLMGPPIEQLTSQGYDLTFGTNVLGHFYLTKLLLPTLLATAAPGQPARVINTSSYGAQLLGGDINYNTLKDSPARKKAGVEKLYYQSKFGNIAFSNELSRQYGDQGIVSVALNPGNVKSGLQRNLTGLTKFIVESLVYPKTHLGALTQLWAGTSDEGAMFGGKYLWPWGRMGKNPSTNPVAEKTLWTWLEEQVADI
ncbi:NAD(P)-binding protein [Mycena sanguinolenta]|uniref:NAD(P)-binding protein n=1 Tax=Mycena sanguinolenta TaxID=230812 RepID=A0A8H6ZDB7_9AGAR|nr:NAD(P)-binding protein [Mycena sanguinolenta]